jgi:uncharacterized membrane protein SirB2
MIAFYLQIKLFHIAVALLSGSLFALRGGFALAGARWPNAAPVRWLSYSIDTALLTAALMLLTILPHATFANGWLWVKLTLIVTYVGLGVMAMRRAKSQAMRAVCYVAALAVFASIYATARSHEPLGLLRWWFG